MYRYATVYSICIYIEHLRMLSFLYIAISSSYLPTTTDMLFHEDSSRTDRRRFSYIDA